MQYRASFLIWGAGAFLGHLTEFLGIWALFDRFDSLRGWRLPEIAFFYGLIHVALALAEGIGRGFDVFPRMVKSGDFDRLLLRPRSTALQVGAAELQLLRIGPLAQGLIVLAWSTTALGVDWTAARVGLTIFAVLGAASLFAGLFVLQATLAFWTTETMELFNILTYGGRDVSQYPLAIYNRWLQRFFTFIVPLACVSYYPALAVLDRHRSIANLPTWLPWITPLIGVAFLTVSLQVWKIGVRHYRSTGS
ncbi:MAG: ABC-2 family transporter protein [Phycisphaerae bacterium]|nr:ABC-2 family transporter protein [Phycisphaerae bacterium]